MRRLVLGASLALCGVSWGWTQTRAETDAAIARGDFRAMHAIMKKVEGELLQSERTAGAAQMVKTKLALGALNAKLGNKTRARFTLRAAQRLADRGAQDPSRAAEHGEFRKYSKLIQDQLDLLSGKVPAAAKPVRPSSPRHVLSDRDLADAKRVYEESGKTLARSKKVQAHATSEISKMEQELKEMRRENERWTAEQARKRVREEQEDSERKRKQAAHDLAMKEADLTREKKQKRRQYLEFHPEGMREQARTLSASKDPLDLQEAKFLRQRVALSEKRFANVVVPSSITEENRLIWRAAEAGDPSAQVELAFRYKGGFNSLPKNLAKAKQLVQAAEASGFYSGIEAAADAYSDGSYGYPVDVLKALRLYKKMQTIFWSEDVDDVIKDMEKDLGR